MAKPEQTKKISIPGGVTIIQWTSERGPYFTIEKQYKCKQSGDYKKTNTYFMEQVAELRRVLNNDFPILDGIEVEEPEDDSAPF